MHEHLINLSLGSGEKKLPSHNTTQRSQQACFRVLFFLLPATLTLSSLFLVCMVRFYQLGKNVFNIALYEITHGPLHYDSERLSSVLYNPIDNLSVSNQYLNKIQTNSLHFLLLLLITKNSDH